MSDAPPPTRARVAGDAGLRVFAVIVGLAFWVWAFPWVDPFTVTGVAVLVGCALLVFIGLAIRRLLEVS